MSEAVLLVLLVLALVIVALQLALLKKPGNAALEQHFDQRLDLLNQSLQQTGRGTGDEFSRLRQELAGQIQNLRLDLSLAQKTQLDEIRSTVDTRLEQVRQTVDEKLQGTLETRLGESFKLVSDRLEQVHKGLGEMQTLASGVGDLKRVLTNVKTRGTWGEVQLGALLEQMLTADQYAKNVATTGTAERVEFAIKLPGREPGQPCWLPVDAKFPVEDYQRLLDAAELGDPVAVESATRSLETTLKNCARTISSKYLLPPATTDFGLLFLPTEGLYAEALRRPGLAETIQRDHRVILTGPNTFAAILNSLQMGFRTLAIQQSSSEILNTLSAVKTEFARYSGVLAKVKKRLQEAANSVDHAETRTRVLERHLRDVSVPTPEEIDGSPMDTDERGLI
jgi:DNA recombination protein RmuC